MVAGLGQSSRRINEYLEERKKKKKVMGCVYVF